MPVEVGSIYRLSKNVIYWNVPSFTVLPRKENSRIWSPLFSSFTKLPGNEDTRIFSPPFLFNENMDHYTRLLGLRIQTPDGTLGLIFHSANKGVPPEKFVRFGLVDWNNKEINSCDGELIDGKGLFPNAYFRVEKLVNTEDLGMQNSFRIFCEINTKQNRQTARNSAQTCPLANSVSSASVHFEEETWICMNCEFLNSNAKLFCEICDHSNTAKDKPKELANPVSSASVEFKEETWSCMNCTFLNSNAKLFCEICDHSNTAEDKPKALTSVNDHSRTEILKRFEKIEDDIKLAAACLDSFNSTTTDTNSETDVLERLRGVFDSVSILRDVGEKKSSNSGNVKSIAGNLGSSATNLPLCIICLENERNIVFQPCCHLITCRDCANLLNDCPTCRKPIKNKLKVFIN